MLRILQTNANIDLGKLFVIYRALNKSKQCDIVLHTYYIDYHYKRIVKYHYLCDVISVSQVQQKREILVLIPI